MRKISRVFLFLFLCSKYFSADLYTSCFQLFMDNNLQLNVLFCTLYSKKVFSCYKPSFLFGGKWMSTNNSTENKSELGSYLAGLIESDGSIIIPKNSLSKPTIKIVFNIKDRPLANCLMERLGSGSIQSASENAVLYVIRDKLGIVNIVNLINGEFRTPKIKALHKIIDWINANPKYNNSNIIDKMPLNTTPLGSNSWFSGFTEGDGSFNIRVTEGIKYNNISVTYTISQGSKDESVLLLVSVVGYLLILFFCYDSLNSGCLLSLAAIIPIKSYSNVEADKDKILSDNKNKSGIYKWTNLINDKQYIGSAINLSNRLSDYYSTTYMEDALTRSNSHIYRALLKNGYENFSLTILEYCEPEQCFEREDFYLSSENNEYNISKKAGASMFGRSHSDATKKQISDALTGSNKSLDTKRKMSDAQPTYV